jgi:hypothetical protein
MGTYLPPGGVAMTPPSGFSAQEMPSPPRLHWGWVLGLNIVTRGLFSSVWLVVQANWVRKVQGRSTAFGLALANLCLLPFFFMSGMVVALLGAANDSNVIGGLTISAVLAVLVLYTATVFTLRSEFSKEPINIQLGGVLIFILGPIYIQYYLRDYETGGSRMMAGSLGLSDPSV